MHALPRRRASNRNFKRVDRSIIRPVNGSVALHDF